MLRDDTKALLIRNGITQKELADSMNVSVITINRKINKDKFNIKEYAKLCKYAYAKLAVVDEENNILFEIE